MSAVDVTVIMPAYNAQETIGEALASCLASTLPSLEVVVVDDGSTDDTARIVRGIADAAPGRIRLIGQEHGGRAAARDTGLAHATGAHVGFVDADDLAHPDMFRSLLEKAVETGADVVVCGYESFDSDTGATIHVYDEGDASEYGVPLRRNPRLLTRVSASVCNKLFRRDLFDRADVRFPIGRDFEDLAVTYPLLLAANRIDKVDRVLYRYRRGHDTSIMGANDERYFRILDALTDVNAAFGSELASEPLRASLEWVNIVHALSGRAYDLFTTASTDLARRYARAAHAHLDGSFPGWRRRLLSDASFGRFAKRVLLSSPLTARYSTRRRRESA